MTRGRNSPAGEDGGGAAWEPVWQGDGEPEAEIVAGGLKSRGLRARVQGSSAVAHTLTPYTQGSWAVIVPRHQAARARAWLRRQGEGPGVVDDPGPVTRDQIATLKFAAIAVVLMVWLIVVLAVLGR